MNSFNIWLNNIFPSLFPFFIISNLLINYNFVYIISKLFTPLFTKLFKINGNAAFIFFLSMLTGFPSCAKYTKELYLNNQLNEYEANKIMMFSHFSNPLFILGTIYTIINNKTLCYIIMFSQYISNIIIGLIVRNYHPSTINKDIKIIKSKPFSKIFTESIISGIDTLLLILGTITTFLIISTIITNVIPLNNINKALFCGILEITQGLKNISLLNTNIYYKAILITAIISFGGLSVHTQIINIINDTKIKYYPFLLARMLHMIIASVISFLAIKIYCLYI